MDHLLCAVGDQSVEVTGLPALHDSYEGGIDSNLSFFYKIRISLGRLFGVLLLLLRRGENEVCFIILEFIVEFKL